MSILGNRVLRREDPAFLTVGGTYVADLQLENEAHLVYARSFMGHAQIASIDTSDAEASPGVLAVLTSADLAELGTVPHLIPSFPEATKRQYLAAETVRYVGEPVVAVIAETLAQAVDAAELVYVDYEPLPVIIDVERAALDETLLFPEHGTNVMNTMSSGGRADFDGADETEIDRLVQSRALDAFVHPEDLERLLRCFEPPYGSFDADFRGRIGDGSYRWFNVRGQLTLDAHGRLTRIGGFLGDVSERKQSEELRERFLERVIAAEDDERRRIAHGLHDETGQALTSLLVGLRSLEPHLDGETARDRLRQLRQLLGTTLDEIGRVARGLHPSVLDDLGLASAVERHVSDFTSIHGIEVDSHIDDLDVGGTLPQLVATSLYRIVQEAFTNVARHAQASRVSLVIRRQGDSIRLVVEDDGCGFDPEQPRNGARGLGLHGIHERAALLKGKSTVESTPGVGTSLYVELPLPRPINRSLQEIGVDPAKRSGR